jgi:hypothetical protein
MIEPSQVPSARNCMKRKTFVIRGDYHRFLRRALRGIERGPNFRLSANHKAKLAENAPRMVGARALTVSQRLRAGLTYVAPAALGFKSLPILVYLGRYCG